MSAPATRSRHGRRAATVWPTARPDPVLPTAAAHPRPCGVPSAVAAYAIAVHSQPGTTVCDPDCGSGAVVVEAVRVRRHAIGITTDTDQWETARAALTTAKAHGAPGDGMILDQPPDRSSWTGLGPVDLLLTAIGPPPDPLEVDELTGESLRTRLAGYRDLSRPGACLIIVAAYHLSGQADLASQIAAAGRDTGWRPVQRAIALTATPASQQIGSARPPSRARSRPAHHDVIVFRDRGHRHQPPLAPPPAAADPRPTA